MFVDHWKNVAKEKLIDKALEDTEKDMRSARHATDNRSVFSRRAEATFGDAVCAKLSESAPMPA